MIFSKITAIQKRSKAVTDYIITHFFKSYGGKRKPKMSAIPAKKEKHSAAIAEKMFLDEYAPYIDERSFDWQWHTINFNRIAVVNLLLNKFVTPTYLEIGCASNALFDSVPALKKIGVDPVAGGNVRETSDVFFEKNHDRFDVVFIDGLHTYEQVRKDIINALSALNPGGWIALHDMLPRNWVEQHVPRIQPEGAWTGDVWKVAFELLQTEGVEFKILKIDYGVGVIKVMDPKTTLKDLRSELIPQKFSYYYENIDNLPITDWRDAQHWF